MATLLWAAITSLKIRQGWGGLPASQWTITLETLQVSWCLNGKPPGCVHACTSLYKTHVPGTVF
jgi:hypothetical protein